VFGHRNNKNVFCEQLSVKEEEHDSKGKFNEAKEVQYCFSFNYERKGAICKKLFMKEGEKGLLV
jgi:hypothetical protein